MDNQTFLLMSDLFETPETLPTKVQDILIHFGELKTYKRCALLLYALQSFGYSFEYYLDAIPFNLHKII